MCLCSRESQLLLFIEKKTPSVVFQIASLPGSSRCLKYFCSRHAVNCPFLGGTPGLHFVFARCVWITWDYTIFEISGSVVFDVAIGYFMYLWTEIQNIQFTDSSRLEKGAHVNITYAAVRSSRFVQSPAFFLLEYMNLLATLLTYFRLQNPLTG
jgi:hypothetical protein